MDVRMDNVAMPMIKPDDYDKCKRIIRPKKQWSTKIGTYKPSLCITSRELGHNRMGGIYIPTILIKKKFLTKLLDHKTSKGRQLN